MNEILEKLKSRLVLSIWECKASRSDLTESHSLLVKLGKVEKDFVYYASLKKLNEIYDFGVDMADSNADLKVIEALNNFICSLDYEIEEDGRIVAAIENDFSSYVSNIPAMLIDMFLNITDYGDIADIFIKQLRANNKYYQADNEVSVFTYQDEVFEGFKDYEIKLLEAVLVGDFEKFKSLALEYFRYYYKSKVVKKLSLGSNISVKEMLIKVDDLIEAIRIKYFAKKKEISKSMVNTIRNALDKSIREDKDSIENMLKEIENLSKARINPSIDVILELNRVYKLNLKMTADYPMVVEALKKTIEKIKLDIEKVIILKNALSREGIKETTLSFPRLIFTIEDRNLAIQYLFLKGIKINGESKKDNLDDFESQLYSYEVQMANLINDDYSVSSNKKQEFLELYLKYLRLYACYIDDNLVCSTGNKAAKRIKNIMHNMSLYIDNAPAWLVTDTKEQIVLRREKWSQETIMDPLDEYIKNGVVVKFLPLECFKKLLEASNLSDNKKYEYLRQMANFMKRNIDVIIKQVLSGFLSVLELNIYTLAEDSKDPEISEIVKDIKAAATLLIDLEDDDLVSEIMGYINILKTKGLSKDKTLEDLNMSQIVYFKNNEQEPFMLSNLDRNSFKQIRISLKKIIDGKFDGDKEIKGINSPFKFRAKGKNKKIVYTIVDNVIIIIGVFNSGDLALELDQLVNREEFRLFINNINDVINNGQIIGEAEYTDYIMSILNGPMSRN